MEPCSPNQSLTGHLTSLPFIHCFTNQNQKAYLDVILQWLFKFYSEEGGGNTNAQWNRAIVRTQRMGMQHLFDGGFSTLDAVGLSHVSRSNTKSLDREAKALASWAVVKLNGCVT
jgi:hypothetical protein